MSYQHLTQQQRYQIAALHKANFACRYIAGVVQCHHSAVARELRRNTVGRASTVHARRSARQSLGTTSRVRERGSMPQAGASWKGICANSGARSRFSGEAPSRSVQSGFINTLPLIDNTTAICGRVAVDDDVLA